MKSVTQWQQELKAAADRKFPTNSEWDASRHLKSIQDQLDDVRGALEVELGVRQSDDHAHQDPDHRIAALIADILILAEKRGADVEGELGKVLEWFEKRD